MGIFQPRNFVARRFHIHTEASERVERFQNVIVDFFVGGKFVREKSRRRMFGFEKWQLMFADPEIPVWMTDPSHLQIILKIK